NTTHGRGTLVCFGNNGSSLREMIHIKRSRRFRAGSSLILLPTRSCCTAKRTAVGQAQARATKQAARCWSVTGTLLWKVLNSWQVLLIMTPAATDMYWARR